MVKLYFSKLRDKDYFTSLESLDLLYYRRQGDKNEFILALFERLANTIGIFIILKKHGGDGP